MFDIPFPLSMLFSRQIYVPFFRLQHCNGERGVKRNNLKPQMKKTNKKVKNIVFFTRSVSTILHSIVVPRWRLIVYNVVISTPCITQMNHFWGMYHLPSKFDCCRLILLERRREGRALRNPQSEKT